jgi:hypothetical protein
VAGLAPAAPSEEVFSCLTGLIGRHKIPFFLDSGAFTATMSLDLVVKLGLPYSRTETRHTLADGSVGTALGLTSPVSVRIGKKDYPTSFLIMEKNVSPATLGIRQMSDIKGAWHFCSRTAEGFIETYDGERIALQPFDPVEGTNIVAALTVVAAHPRAFEPISFTEPFQPIATEPYVVHLTPEAAALPPAFPKRRSWNRRDATVIADYFEKRLANNMWRVVEEAELSALKWLTYPFCVDKKGGSGRRVVFNFAETANRYTVPDPFRMSDPETTRNATSGASLMSLLDMEESFSQFPLAPESQLYFATELPDGRIVVPTVIVMGPTNSPAAVQRRNEALVFAVNKSGQLTGQSVLPAPHIDDFVVATKSEAPGVSAVAAHAHDLNVFLAHAEEKGYHFSLQKSRLFVGQGTVLGLLRTPDGLLPPPEKLGPILDLPYPTSLPQVRHLLGVLNEFSMFIPGYAEIAEPLYDLTSKSPSRDYGHIEVLNAVDALKRAVTEAPCLLPVDEEQPMRLEVDASGRAWAAVLLQRGPDALWHPCHYVSKLFNPAQRKYSATDRELVGVVSAARALAKYAQNNPNCVVVNDHKAVSALMKRNPIELSALQARCLSLINDWGLRLEWTPGESVVVADALSRAWDHLAEEKLPDETAAEVHRLAALLHLDIVPGTLRIDWRSEQLKDPQLKTVVR